MPNPSGIKSQWAYLILASDLARARVKQATVVQDWYHQSHSPTTPTTRAQLGRLVRQALQVF